MSRIIVIGDFVWWRSYYAKVAMALAELIPRHPKIYLWAILHLENDWKIVLILKVNFHNTVAGLQLAMDLSEEKKYQQEIFMINDGKPSRKDGSYWTVAWRTAEATNVTRHNKLKYRILTTTFKWSAFMPAVGIPLTRCFCCTQQTERWFYRTNRKK
jgi:hypothetical protein